MSSIHTPRLSTKNIMVALLSTGFGLALALPAQAADSEKIRVSGSYSGKSVTLSVPASYLETEDGTAKLYKALEKKAEAACQRTIPSKLGRTVPLNRCMNRVMDGFVDTIDNERMSEMHRAKNA